MSLMIIMNSISVAIRGAIPENAKKYLSSVEEQFKGTSKAHASTLILKMLTSKYDGVSGVREHIMMMSDMANKLKGMDMEISEGFLVHFIMTSLPMQFGPFKINYNTQKEKWKMSELIAMCVQEEERLKVEKPDVVHVTTTNSNKRKGSWKSKGSSGDNSTPNKVQKTDTSTSSFQGGPKCKFCHKKGHTQKDCPKFKEWLAKKGIFESFMINESFNINVPINSWWIDSGSMVHIANSLQGFRTIRRLERNQRTVKVGNGVDLNVEAIGTLSLILEGGFRSKGYRFYCPSHSTRIVETRHVEFLENANNSGSGSFRRIELQEAQDKTPIIHVPISISTPLNTSNDHLIVQDHPNNVEENEPNPEINAGFDLGKCNDPKFFKDDITCDQSAHWREVMEDELNSMSKNNVWELAELPKGAEPVGCKWVFTIKLDPNGNIERYKARLVAKGYTQKEGVDYKETFSPVSRKDSLRIVMALVAHFDLELHQMDVKIAFLNGDLHEDVYMAQP
ncbi:putative zinc finger, CCHC-type containing protein [Tanacetum coccineum]